MGLFSPLLRRARRDALTALGGAEPAMEGPVRGMGLASGRASSRPFVRVRHTDPAGREDAVAFDVPRDQADRWRGALEADSRRAGGTLGPCRSGVSPRSPDTCRRTSSSARSAPTGWGP